MVDWFNLILLWWPWLSFWSDIWFLQLFILYLFFLISFNTNLYYLLLYLFLEIFLFGIFLSIIQMDLFTGFLWVTEATAIFILVIVLFYLNSKGNWLKLNLKIYKFFYFFIFLFFIFFSLNYISEFENYIFIELNIIDIWDDYYEAINNINNNDFLSLFLSYYYFNSFELLLLGLLLLLGSIICINLYKINYNIKIQNYDNFFNFFNFFNDFINYFFYRKQNLFKQQNNLSSTKIFKKK